MNTSRYTPELIVKESLHFNIPLYQRLFAWGKEEVRGLLYDLKEHFASSNDNSPYYLGMLSCIGKGNEYDLIDGQQRFSVMMLMAIVLREYDLRWNAFLAEGKRLDFVARTKDREYLYSVICNDSMVQTEDINEKMNNAIEEIKTFMLQNFTNNEHRTAFAKQIYERLSFFFSVLPDEYMNNPTSLNKYFEAMNAGGKGLEQHEVLKVQLLRGLHNQEWLTRIWNSVSDMSRQIIKKREEISENEYRQLYINAITLCQEGNFEGAFNLCESSFDVEDNIEIGMVEAEERKKEEYYKEEPIGQAILSFPEFLMMILDITLSLNGSYSFYRTELLHAFRENAIKDIPAFYNTLLFYRLLFDYYVVTRENNANGNRYNIVNHQGEPFAVECVCQYESMLYVSQTPFYNWLKPLLIELSSLPVIDSETLLVMLKKIDNNLRGQLLPIESLSYVNGPDRYWFWRLDYYLWEKKDKYFSDSSQRDIVNDYIFRSNRSLEHLHPQHQDNNTEWPKDKVDTFGNLAMISQSFNSQQSDEPVTVKFARIADQANNHSLQSIKLYCMYLEASGYPDGWTIERMEKHEKLMYSILLDSFANVDTN